MLRRAGRRVSSCPLNQPLQQKRRHCAVSGRYVMQGGVLLSIFVRRPEPSNRGVSMAENKTKFTDASVEAYIASRANVQQRSDCRELMVLLKRVTRRSPRMWGPSIVGYGSYRYTYESGHTGEAPLTGFAIRGRELVVYLVAEGDRQKTLLSKLGKHKMGKSCLYFKQLADLDKSALKQLVTNSVADVKRRYG